jgi:hypothetical protein
MMDKEPNALEELAAASRQLFGADPDWGDFHPVFHVFKRSHDIDADDWRTYFGCCRAGSTFAELVCPSEAIRDLISAKYGPALVQAFGHDVTLVVERSAITITTPHTETP